MAAQCVFNRLSVESAQFGIGFQSLMAANFGVVGNLRLINADCDYDSAAGGLAAESAQAQYLGAVLLVAADFGAIYIRRFCFSAMG